MRNPDGSVYRGMPAWLFATLLVFGPFLATQVAWLFFLSTALQVAAAASVMIVVLGSEVWLHRKERLRQARLRRRAHVETYR